ncbi:hypothetical protein POM88_006757 [Heracleum sosnowskyi]|uniref:DUF4378 domain-containing protein n=1 Tax=Heracleum sosnowskyi TaxID=360622 RepID=A0AAD8J3B0_9APIA|nr:hypothetical protein POM88_006757 [Heracleum sosnowskyi]
MPQDNLRSVVYKSFVTCDDPRGVVDCRTTFRNSKPNSQKPEEKLQRPKMLKKLRNATLHKDKKKEMVSKGGTEISHSFQLTEVSRGAQKLNQMIDSWSKHTGQSNHIANDMLMGALDLQDSLVMLSKLQEASQYMTKLNKKPCVGKADEVGVRRTSSDRFGNPNYQNPRLSSDGSSRDSHEELRQVIRNSLARQNFLPPNSSAEKSCIHTSKTIYNADMTSTSSSSMSSMAYPHDFASSVSTSSSKISEVKKPRNSNLIAKLMGLEDFSSKIMQSASLKQLRRDRGLTQKLIFDIDMQNGRKPQVVGQKVDRGCMTLEDVIDSMHFKGLLKSNQDQMYHPNTSDTERRLSNDASPIVLIKPAHPGIDDEKHFQRKLVQDRAALESKKRQKIWKRKEETAPKITECHRGYFNSNELCGKSQSGEPPMENLSPEKEKEAKTSRHVFAKPRDVEVIIERKQSSNKMRAYVPVSSLPRNNENIVEKKVDKIQKDTIQKEQVEIESLKCKTKSVPRSPEEDKDDLTKLRKSETGSNIMRKNCISQKTSSTSIPRIKHPKSALTDGESDQKRSLKNSKPVKEPLTTANVPSMVCNNDKLTNLKEKSKSSKMDGAPVLQLVTEKETDIRENCDDRLITLCKDLMLPTPYEFNTRCPDYATDYHQHDLKEIIFCRTETTANVTISRTQEKFKEIEPSNNCDAYQPIVLETPTNSHDSELLNSKLLRDCANELLESRSERDKLDTIPLLHVPISDSRVCMFKDKLMEEGRNEIENLGSKHGVHSVPDGDIVYSVLERDILCKGLAAGAWDLGWREGFTRNEVEQIVSDLDRKVIDQLIEEVLADLV